MKHVTRLFLLGLCAGLGACSDPPPAPELPAPQPQAATAERGTPAQITRDNQGVLTGTQAAAINAANQVSNALQDAEKERQHKLEEATR